CSVPASLVAAMCFTHPMRIAVVIVAVTFASCAHDQPRAHAREVRAVDTSTVFVESDAAVHDAAVRGLAAIGYDVVDGDVIATKPRAEVVAGWRWLEAEHPGAAVGATAVA